MSETHLHNKTYISNPAQLVSRTAKQLFDNLGVVAAHLGVSIGAIMPFAIAVGLSFLPAVISNGDKQALVLFPILLILVLALPFMYVMNWVGLAQKRLTLAILEDKKPTFKEIFKHDSKKLFGLIGLGFITGLAVFGGYLLLVIPGIVLLILFSYAPYIYVKEDIGVVDAMGESFKLVRSSWQELLGVSSIFFIYRGVSYALSNIPILGMLFSLAFIPLNIFVAYLQDLAIGYRYTSLASGTNRPKVDSLNWVFISLAMILIIVSMAVLVFIIVYLLVNDNVFTRLFQNYIAVLS